MLNWKKSRYHHAKWVTLIGALVNCLLGILKCLGGIWFHSSALLADGFHSLSDLLTDGLVLLASKYGSQDADDAHPYGHQRIETAVTYILAFLLILTGLAIAWDAISNLHHHHFFQPNILALPIVMLSILLNEMLFWYTRLIGQRIESNLIIANAWHHRSDAASSLIVLIGLLASMIGFPMLDLIAALIVGLFITKMGLNYAMKSVKELIDTGVNLESRLKIKQIIHETDGVEKIHQLRTRMMGQDIFVDVHVQVNPIISVSEGHFIAQNVHQRLKKYIDGIKDVTVHIDPEDDEIVSPSKLLPSRTALDGYVLKAWKADFPEIEHYILHYLEGKLIVDLIGSFTPKKRAKLLHKIQLDCNAPPLRHVCIRIQSPPEHLIECNERPLC